MVAFGTTNMQDKKRCLIFQHTLTNRKDHRYFFIEKSYKDRCFVIKKTQKLMDGLRIPELTTIGLRGSSRESSNPFRY